MIDKQNRLRKLAAQCDDFDSFMETAIRRSSWYLAPYVQAGENVNRPWIENFWTTKKGRIV